MNSSINHLSTNKNLFSKSEITKGLMIKCWYNNIPSNRDIYVLDMIIKKVPYFLSYSVCEERGYFEVYLPSSVVKKYDFQLEDLIKGDEFFGIVRKVKKLKPTVTLNLNLFSEAHNKVTSGFYLLRLKALLS